LPRTTKLFGSWASPMRRLALLQAWLMAEHNVKVSIGCLWKRLRQLGLTLKKSHCGPPNKTARTSPRPATNGVQASPI
jgi:transposase